LKNEEIKVCSINNKSSNNVNLKSNTNLKSKSIYENIDKVKIKHRDTINQKDGKQLMSSLSSSSCKLSDRVSDRDQEREMDREIDRYELSIISSDP
jgi:hypothetical protein